MAFSRRGSVGAALAIVVTAVGCGGPSSVRMSATEMDSAVAQMRSVQAPAGFRPGALVCVHGYACWTAPQGPLLTDASYRVLAQRFGVILKTSHCDPPLTSHAGLTIEDCLGGGRYGRYVTISTLTATSDSLGHGHTEIDFAPVRRLQS